MDMQTLKPSKANAGWYVAVVLLLLAGWSFYHNMGSNPAKELARNVTIRCTETGETWQVPLGVVEKELMSRPFPVDPNDGLVNPKTGHKTGFPVDDWKSLVRKINAERAPEGSSPPAESAASTKPAPPTKAAPAARS